MKIRNKSNGGVATVKDDYGQALIDGGSWEPADKPKRRRQTKKTGDKAAQHAEQIGDTAERLNEVLTPTEE